jgi:hypothetical protein
MAFDASIADRVRPLMRRKRGFAEKKMFGGVGFLLDGNMCVGVWKEFLIVRCGPDAYQDALQRRGVREFDITGRAMAGWVMIEPVGFRDDAELTEWVTLAVDFVRTLPGK